MPNNITQIINIITTLININYKSFIFEIDHHIFALFSRRKHVINGHVHRTLLEFYTTIPLPGFY